MQNNKETNENVSRVVAEFFKKKPRNPDPSAQVKAPKPQYNNRYPRSNDKTEVTEVKNPDANVTNQESQAHTSRESGFNHNRKNFRNKNRFNKHNNDKRAQESTSEQTEITAENKEAQVNADQDVEVKVETVVNEPVKTQNTDDNSSQNEWYDPDLPVEIIGVRFQAGGKIYYFAPNGLTAQKGENVI